MFYSLLAVLYVIIFFIIKGKHSVLSAKSAANKIKEIKEITSEIHSFYKNAYWQSMHVERRNKERDN